MSAPKPYSFGEELASSITHGIGALLGISAVTLLAYRAALFGTVWHVVSSVVFGVTIILMYAASTLYHAIPFPRAKRILKVCDHIAIYLLIAGTYTPFALVTFRENNPILGWSIFGIVWGCALGGAVFKLFFTGRWRLLSTFIYLGMGWLVVFAFKPLCTYLPMPGLVLMAAGGMCYTTGAVFYLIKRVPYFHAVWHLFVLGGTICHFFSILLYVIRVDIPGM